MALGLIVAILIIGLLLIFLEIFFIPGTTVFGIAGGVIVVLGIGMMYAYYGKQYGNITLMVSAVAVVAAIVAGFKVIDSNTLAMKGEINSKVNQLETKGAVVGDKGIAVTDLRPNGKAVFNDRKVDVYSNGDFIPRDASLEIIKITNEKIFVTLLKS